MPEEINRIIHVINGILDRNPEAIISLDTTKSVVAEEALKAGAKIINDISGLMCDPLIPDVVKKHDAYVIIMHKKNMIKHLPIRNLR